MTSLLYQAYQNHTDLTEPWRSGALQALKYLNLLPQGMSDKFFRRLAAVGHVRLSGACFMYTSARRYHAMGKGAVFGLYIRNFWSELLRHRPSDRTHLDVRT